MSQLIVGLDLLVYTKCTHDLVYVFNGTLLLYLHNNTIINYYWLIVHMAISPRLIKDDLFGVSCFTYSHGYLAKMYCIF